MKKINIKIVADITCPWCFIGCNHLNTSLKSRNYYKYEIDWQPFYLNPTMPSKWHRIKTMAKTNLVNK